MTNRLPYCTRCTRYTHVLADDDGRDRCLNCGYWESIVYFPVPKLETFTRPSPRTLVFLGLLAVLVGALLALKF